MYILVLLGKKDVFSIFEEIIGDLWHLMDYVTETVSNRNNSVCGLKNSSDPQYFCRHYYKIWSRDHKDWDKCSAQGGDEYCSDPANNQNVCSDLLTHPKVASSLLFFFLLNYVMGLVTCVRLEGWKLVPLIAALINVYPQFCKETKTNL